MSCLKIVAVIFFVCSLAGLSFGAGKKSACIECHKKVTPGVVRHHLEGKMSKAGVDCLSCHGSDHKKADDAKLAKMPTPETCRLP